MSAYKVTMHRRPEFIIFLFLEQFILIFEKKYAGIIKVT